MHSLYAYSTSDISDVLDNSLRCAIGKEAAPKATRLFGAGPWSLALGRPGRTAYGAGNIVAEEPAAGALHQHWRAEGLAVERTVVEALHTWRPLEMGREGSLRCSDSA